MLIEQLRGIESQELLSNESDTARANGSGGHSFDDRLLQRAQQLSRQHKLEDTLSHAAGVWRFSNISAGLVAVILGAIASLTAVAGGSTINIYWLMLVLVGFNLLSMALWLLGVSAGLDSLISGVLSRSSAWLPTLLGKRDTATGQADRAWLRCHFGGTVGKWRFSQLTQQLWLLYLCTGLVALVVVLMARQFDFVWGTTLLSDESFVRLTSALGQPLQVLGFATPGEQQVLETRIGAGYALNAQHRYSWAQFLIGALLLLGILPRLLLWIASKWMLGCARRRFALDYYLPYYIRLRQELMPMHGRSEIVDADNAAPVVREGAAPLPRESVRSVQVPPGVQWVAIELEGDMAWPLHAVSAGNNLGEIVDRRSQDEIIARIQTGVAQDVAIAVAASRAPDRGLRRTVSLLCAAAARTWLVLLEKNGDQPVSESRLTAWYRLAQECEVPAENVVSMRES